jgi:hypothetical protein
MQRDRAVLLLAAFVVLYSGAIVWSQAATRLDPPTARLLAPAFPALAILIVLGVHLVMRRVSADAAAWAAGSGRDGVRRRGATAIVTTAWCVIALLAVVASVASLRANLRLIDEARAGSLGLESVAAGSALIAAAEALPDADGFGSNDPWAVYLGVGGGPAVHLPPSADEWPAERLERDLSVLVDAVRSGEVTHAVVFSGGSTIQALDDLAPSGVTATLVLETPEGSVYRLSAADTITE